MAPLTPHLSPGSKQSISTDFNCERKKPINIFPLYPTALVERPEISSVPQHLPKQIESIYYCQKCVFSVFYKICIFCIWRKVVLDKLSSLPSKILYSLLLLLNFKDRRRGWKCQYVINSPVAGSWHQSFRWRAMIEWSSLKLQQVQGRYSTSFAVSSGEILRWNWWTLIDCLLITPADRADKTSCPYKIVCSHSFLPCHSCNLCKK